tara:strand:+ start:16 stop:486 length:471 start_codon:yes stop_codon:yes gene_type:complete
MQSKRVYKISEAKERIKDFCSLQDKCQWDVRKKLSQWGLLENTKDLIMMELIEDGFIDEERFSKSFCRGKFRIKKWGRLKIVNELKSKNISNVCIRKGLQQIKEEEYLKTLQELYDKKKSFLKDNNWFIKKGKIAKHLQQKGFESSLVWELINKDK